MNYRKTLYLLYKIACLAELMICNTYFYLVKWLFDYQNNLELTVFRINTFLFRGLFF
jgi:hypothetical protein